MLEQTEQDRLLALLAWWKGVGVDVAITNDAVDWTTRPTDYPGAGFPWPDLDQASPETATPARRPPAGATTAATAPAAPEPATERRPQRTALTVTQTPARAFPTATPDAATMAAREAARRAQSLEALEAILQTFDGCALKVTAKSLCFYRGSAKARLMVIGEAPGREEDLEGKPFVGRSGQLLDKMLAAIGLGEADVHITNTVYWRPPGNRPPTPQETLICKPFLERQITLVAPQIIVTLGGPAAKAVLGVEDGILRTRGKWRDLGIGDGSQTNVRVMPTLHPAYLLRSPDAKRLAWRDLLAIKAALAAPPGKATP